jgi:decaprenyl-phosphate phosphoribosyltransferase
VLAPAAAARPRPGVVLRACRPRQWLKNVVVVLAPAAAGALTRPGVALEVCGALVAFCLLSSSTYLLNDVRDRASDRLHPRKRFRPIAAGELSPSRALRIAALLAIAGVALGFAIRPALGAVAICYLTLTLSYSFVWRQVTIADIVMVAAGFLVRAAAGGVAANVRLSGSFLVVTSACALFLVVGKRYAEVGERGTRAGTRRTLRHYSPLVLRRVLIGAAALGCVAYARWAFTRPELGPWIELSLLPFALWLGRYAMMLGAGAGEAPEELILRDPALLALGALWGILFVTGLYGAQ